MRKIRIQRTMETATWYNQDGSDAPETEGE